MAKSITLHSFKLILLLFFVFTFTGSVSGLLDDQSTDLFNERGYRKGSSFDVTDQGEMINEFNGNLIYRKTLLFQPGVGDLDLEITLTYNGAVAHTMQQANPIDPHTGEHMGGTHPQSANFPMWILGVNGVAVWVFGKNRCAYSDIIDPPRWQSYLVTGYDKSNEAVGGSSGYSKYSLSFLMADGTVEQYYDDDPEEPQEWSGFYRPCSPDNFSKGWLTYSFPFNHRKFYLRRPNGITITYHEFVPKYRDLTNPNTAVGCPHLFLPVRIEDRHGII